MDIVSPALHVIRQAAAHLHDSAARTPGFLTLVMLTYMALLAGLDRLASRLSVRGPRWAYWCRWARIYARISVLMVCTVLVVWRVQALFG